MTDERPNEPWLLRRLGLGDGPADLRFGWRIVAALLAIYAVSFALFYPEVPTNVDEAAYISQAVMLLEPEAEVIQIDPFTGDEVSMVLDTYPLGTALITAPLVALFGWRSAYAVA